MFKRAKKVESAEMEEDTFHLFLKSSKLPLLMIRPEELIEFGEFAGSEAEDILLWVGKSIGQTIFKEIIGEQDVTDAKLQVKMNIITTILDKLQSLGFGVMVLNHDKDKIIIDVANPLAKGHLDNIMARNICIIYSGMFNGMMDKVGIDSESDEINCVLRGAELCSFKFELEEF